jgi:RNA polymerase sigma-32 factor
VGKYEEDRGEKIDLLADEGPDPETMTIRENSHSHATNLIAKVMSQLTEREVTIIQKRTMAVEPVTLEKLSLEFGVTPERIRQVEVAAMHKMRRKLEDLGLNSLEDLF